MAEPGATNKEKEADLEHMAEEVFSSEKREDIWAIIIAVVLMLLADSG